MYSLHIVANRISVLELEYLYYCEQQLDVLFAVSMLLMIVGCYYITNEGLYSTNHLLIQSFYADKYVSYRLR